MSNSYFRFKQFTIEQSLCAMKVGTDGVMLGAWACGGNKILDIGTGTGLIALMMAQRYPAANVTAIDIDDNACRQASQNVYNSPFGERIGVRNISLQKFTEETELANNAEELLFDAIISNPPFFNNSLKNPDASRSVARHTVSLSYHELCNCAYRLLCSNGEFSVVIPFDCKNGLEVAAESCGFIKVRECAVRTTPRKSPRRWLIAYRKNFSGVLKYEEGIIENSPNNRSEWYNNLMKDFYL